MIDSHPMGQESTSHDAKDFVANWKWVWSKFACLPNFSEDMKGRLFVDILNEPDSQGQGWQEKNGKAGESLVRCRWCVVVPPRPPQPLLSLLRSTRNRTPPAADLPPIDSYTYI